MPSDTDRVSWLQWGRGLTSAETIIEADQLDENYIWLQWGRTFVSAEMVYVQVLQQ
jgi:hypothetical protein